MVRVWVKASPAEGRRRFHPDRVYVHYWGFSRCLVAVENFRSFMENPYDFSILFSAAEELSRVNMFDEVIRMFRMGRMTALQKPRGGVRGKVAGDIVRRLVSFTIGGGIRAGHCSHQYAL